MSLAKMFQTFCLQKSSCLLFLVLLGIVPALHATAPSSANFSMPAVSKDSGGKEVVGSTRRLQAVVGQGYRPLQAVGATREAGTGFLRALGASQECSQSLSLPLGAWAMFGVTCQQGTLTVQDQFTGVGELAAANYGPSGRWYIYEYDVPSQSYVGVDISDVMEEGRGYWIKTLDPVGPITLDSSIGAIAGPFTYSGDSGFNLFSNVYTEDIDWTDGSGILVDHGVIEGLLDSETAGAINSTAFSWVGSGYQTHPASGPIEVPIPSGRGFFFEGFEPFDLIVPVPSSRRSRRAPDWKI